MLKPKYSIPILRFWGAGSTFVRKFGVSINNIVSIYDKVTKRRHGDGDSNFQTARLCALRIRFMSFGTAIYFTHWSCSADELRHCIFMGNWGSNWLIEVETVNLITSYTSQLSLKWKRLFGGRTVCWAAVCWIRECTVRRFVLEIIEKLKTSFQWVIMGIESLTIELDNPEGVYFPGQEVSGIVHISNLSNKVLKGTQN